jgi:hypothetical protein
VSADQDLIAKLAEYESDGFYIDQHALERVQAHRDMDIWDVIRRLTTNKFDTVVPNDSSNPPLDAESYKVFITKSTSILYCVVLYLPDTIDKPLIKTVYQDDKTAQERLGQ